MMNLSRQFVWKHLKDQNHCLVSLTIKNWIHELNVKSFKIYILFSCLPISRTNFCDHRKPKRYSSEPSSKPLTSFNHFADFDKTIKYIKININFIAFLSLSLFQKTNKTNKIRKKSLLKFPKETDYLMLLNRWFCAVVPATWQLL